MEHEPISAKSISETFGLPSDQAEFVISRLTEEVDLITHRPDVWEQNRQMVVQKQEEADQRIVRTGRAVIPVSA